MAITDEPGFCRYIKSYLDYSNRRSRVTPNTKRIGQPAILGQKRVVFNHIPARPIILAIWRAKMYRIRGPGKGLSRCRGGFGEVSERLIELVSKTSVLFIEYRGFESRPLRCVASLG